MMSPAKLPAPRQLQLPGTEAPPPRFDGETYEPAADQVRMSAQLAAVYAVMQSGEWLDLDEIAARVYRLTYRAASVPSVSARLRDLRKKRFGGHRVERRRVDGGLWEYWLDG